MKIQRSEALPLYAEIKALIETSRSTVVRMVNTAMVYTYFQIGRLIVEYEQKGLKRAAYAKETLKRLSEKLVKEFGRGFSDRNLRSMREFYIAYKKSVIWQTPSAKSGTLLQLSWSLRELERQFNSSLYERLALSREKKTVKDLSRKGH